MNTKEILKKVRRIEIKTSRLVNSVLSGKYHSTFKGRGMEFDEVREYYTGDDIRTIDWNVTARMNSPYVKRYKEERELSCMILYDASSSNEFGTSGLMKGEVAAEISALLSFSAIKNNDKVGLIIFTDEVEKFIPPKKGRDHVLHIIRELLYFKTNNNKTNIKKALDFLNRMNIRKGNIFLISDMISDDFKDALQISSEKHDVTAIKITDPREIVLPNVGMIEFEDAETGESYLIDTADPDFRRNYRRMNVVEDTQLERFFKSFNVDYVNLHINRDYFSDLIIFFKKKIRKKSRG